MQNTGKRCVIVLVFIILRWSFNYESNVFRYNKILIDCVFENSKFVVPSTLTSDLGFASVNSQCLRDNKLAIPSYPVNKYILFPKGIFLGKLLLSNCTMYFILTPVSVCLLHFVKCVVFYCLNCKIFPVWNNIYLLTGYEGIASLLSLRHWLLTEAKPSRMKYIVQFDNKSFPKNMPLVYTGN
jgi:hypothetical protein